MSFIICMVILLGIGTLVKGASIVINKYPRTSEVKVWSDLADFTVNVGLLVWGLLLIVKGIE